MQAAKVLTKLRSRGSEKNAKANDRSFQQNNHRDEKESFPECNNFSIKGNGENHKKKFVSFPAELKNPSASVGRIPNTSRESSSKECYECFAVPRLRSSSPLLTFQSDAKESEPGPEKVTRILNTAQQQPDASGSPGRGRSSSSNSGSSNKSDSESSSVQDCEIQWEDLHFGEEIGRGTAWRFNLC